MKIIMSELNRGTETTEKILKNEVPWDELLEKHDFFHRYRYYLQAIASSDTIDSHRIWSSFVESRLRTLVLKLELTDHVALVHPYVKGFEKTVVCFSEQQALDAGRGIFHEVPGATSDATNTLSEVAEVQQDAENVKDASLTSSSGRTVYTTTFYIGLAIEKNSVTGVVPKKLDISWPTGEFIKMCKAWEKFSDEAMGICVKYLKRYLYNL